jgi:hypothetical protein
MKFFPKKLCIFFASIFLFAGLLGFVPQTSVSAKSNANLSTANNSISTSTYIDAGINDFQGVADYIHQYGVLPDNYITKEQAHQLGWRPGEDLWNYAPGKSIGGDRFSNREEVLPDAPDRIWHECDINYFGGHRGADRLLYSNDGLIYGTTDHYQTFTCYYDDSNSNN